MLFKLSVKNIRRSVRDYAIYFFTLIIGVSVFYVFNSLETQTVMMKMNESTQSIIELMNNMLSGVSVFVSMILAFLIIYASRFLIKRRNREFGVYMTLGMGRRKISMILFLETLLIGLISLVAGLLVGVGLSQMMSVLVANMFDAEMTKYQFVFSWEACVKTMIYFGVMYLFVMIFNTVNISRLKLIDLLQSGRRNETVKMKDLWVCTAVFLVSAVLLGVAYYLVTDGIDKMQNFDMIYVPIAMGIVGTFLVFWSLSGLMLRIVTSIKGIYFRQLNSFTLRQISSQINTMVFSMSIICLMLFVTICILSSALSLRNSLNAQIRELAPADLMLTKEMHLDQSKRKEGMSQKQIDSSDMTILELLNELGVHTDKVFREYVTYPIYKSDELTFGTTLGSRLEEVLKQYRYIQYDSPEEIVTISDYNKAAEMYGNEKYTLDPGQYLIVADFESMVQIRNEALALGETLSVFGHELAPKYKECRSGFLEMAANHITTGIIVVPDEVVEGQQVYTDNIIANYRAETEEEKEKIENKINRLDQYKKDYLLPDGTSLIVIRAAGMGLGGLATFIGLYLGIIFLISSGAILALKELSESADNVERYRMLGKLGADQQMIHKALFRQTGIFFFCPLLLAAIHSIFGIRFSNFILETVGNQKLLISIVMTSVFLVIIYGGYFMITYLCSKNIISPRQ